MEDIYLLRQKAEQEELAAQHAKTEAASSGLEIFLKVEDMRQKMSRERAEYEMVLSCASAWLYMNANAVIGGKGGGVGDCRIIQFVAVSCIYISTV